MNTSTNRLIYTLQIADNALINAQRLGEWCGHGPILEQDIALTNIALDHIGAARTLYQYAAGLFSETSEDLRNAVFSSPALHQAFTTRGKAEEDDIAYLRDAWDFHNVLLTEQVNEDWAYTVVRSFFLDAFNFFFYAALQNSGDEVFAAVGEKSHRETTYHLKWSSEWIIRLGDGTNESKARIQEALNSRWSFTGELFHPSEADMAAIADGYGVDLSTIQQQWADRVAGVIEEATLTLPQSAWMQSGGKEGRHTEHLGYILAEMQYMQRAYPGMEW